MPNIILTQKQIENYFQALTCRLLGIDTIDSGGKPINQNKVRISWPTEGSPAWKVNDDVVFIQVNTSSDSYANQREVNYVAKSNGILEAVASYTRVHLIQWILYGPNSYDNADKIRNGLFDATEDLRGQHLSLVLDVPQPVRFPEPYNGQWWERCNFEANFNELVVLRSDVPEVSGVDIRLLQEVEGVIDTIEIKVQKG
ncbi:MAG: phage neck terminator protein [Coriobacteriia bacterium]